ncbi:TetR/AcrR family transcriptional regulator [Dyella sp. C9]|uniref:TetR/AcrR family transcriptional regulator n=1 Tax=Dyella sp. C9 TaxID=2202154 RepID=UPI000DEF507F|nr:TetR/AcrR family transcriptional regulator [Dyella sp. C9]
MKGPHPGGRPVNEQAGAALLEAARALVAEHGYDKVSMQMIADHAGVGRQTAYRRWPSKADLVLNAFLNYSRQMNVIEPGPVVPMVERFLSQIFADINAVHGRAIRSLIAAAQDDAEFKESFDKQFVKPRDLILLRILRHGVEQGEIPESANLNLVIDAIHGAFWYRLLLGRRLTTRYARELAAYAIHGVHAAA